MPRRQVSSTPFIFLTRDLQKQLKLSFGLVGSFTRILKTVQSQRKCMCVCQKLFHCFESVGQPEVHPSACGTS